MDFDPDAITETLKSDSACIVSCYIIIILLNAFTSQALLSNKYPENIDLLQVVFLDYKRQV